ncbi:hypothetical protein GCM10009602_47530 [Nocardiopsis tropica]
MRQPGAGLGERADARFRSQRRRTASWRERVGPVPKRLRDLRAQYDPCTGVAHHRQVTRPEASLNCGRCRFRSAPKTVNGFRIPMGLCPQTSPIGARTGADTRENALDRR